jgi:hypothetical protein
VSELSRSSAREASQRPTAQRTSVPTTTPIAAKKPGPPGRRLSARHVNVQPIAALVPRRLVPRTLNHDANGNRVAKSTTGLTRTLDPDSRGTLRRVTVGGTEVRSTVHGKDPIRWGGGATGLYECVGGRVVDRVDPSGLHGVGALVAAPAGGGVGCGGGVGLALGVFVDLSTLRISLFAQTSGGIYFPGPASTPGGVFAIPGVGVSAGRGIHATSSAEFSGEAGEVEGGPPGVCGAASTQPDGTFGGFLAGPMPGKDPELHANPTATTELVGIPLGDAVREAGGHLADLDDKVDGS